MIKRTRLKALLVDTLGFSLIIIAVPISWLPGPGGIPLLIVGLSLLATNHEWAENMVQRVRKHGINLSQRLFSNDPRMKWLLDGLSIAFIAGAVLVVTMATRSLTKTAAISLVITALFLFFGNRRRFHSLKKRMNRKA